MKLLDKVRWEWTRARYARPLAARSARALTPPPPEAYARFGTGSVIGPPSRVNNPHLVEIGDHVLIHEHAWLSVVPAVEGYRTRLRIGDHTQIGRLVHIACVGEIDIGRDVLTAERVFIGDTFHRYQDVTLPVLRQPMEPPEKVVIGDGAFLGVGSVVLMGVTVGENAYVGAGAVVTTDVAPRTVVVGNPARAAKRWDDVAREWVSC